MPAFAWTELAAFVWFVLAWVGYSYVIERTARGRVGLNALMNLYRDEWMLRLIGRENRIVDAQVIAALQNGTAFFASTSLIAVGGALSLLRAPEAVLPVIAAVPFGAPFSRELWELKMVGLAVIFVYAFFKFAWAYRLYNYFAIMLGAAPPATQRDGAEAQAFATSAASICRPPLQPRSARLLLRARVSGLVFGSAAARDHDGGRRQRDVATAVYVGLAQSLGSCAFVSTELRRVRPPISTPTALTITTASASRSRQSFAPPSLR